jgi:hypothetical protein
MNSNVVMGILRALVPGLVAYAAGRGWISASSAGDIGAAIITLGAAAWSATTNTDAASLATVAAIPSVAKILVKPSATDGVAAAVDDPSQPKVVSTSTMTTKGAT